MDFESLECRLVFAVCAAAAIWFYMFSPWTAGLTGFWITMSCAAIILTAMAACFAPGGAFVNRNGAEGKFGKKLWQQFLLGVTIAAALWGVFWIGDKISSMIFGFARDQVDGVYSMKTGLPDWTIAALLLFLIGPAEEYFWRGFIQRNAALAIKERYSRIKRPADLAFLFTVLAYALVHVWSLNFMLVMAALVAGCVWGFIYRLRPDWLPALMISHSLWDAAVFVVFPI